MSVNTVKSYVRPSGLPTDPQWWANIPGKPGAQPDLYILRRAAIRSAALPIDPRSGRRAHDPLEALLPDLLETVSGRGELVRSPFGFPASSADIESVEWITERELPEGSNYAALRAELRRWAVRQAAVSPRLTIRETNGDVSPTSAQRGA